MSAAEEQSRPEATGDGRPIGNPYLVQKVIWLDLPEGRKRTSIRMEEVFWRGLDRVAQLRGCSRDRICSDAVCALPDAKQTSAIRMFIFTALTNIS